MKYFAILVFTCFSFVSLVCDEAKVQAVFEETHKKVQEVLSSDKVHESRKNFEIQSIVRRGKKKLDDMKSFYVVRHAFDDAEKIKQSIEKYEHTDFKLKSLDVQPKVAEVKNDDARLVVNKGEQGDGKVSFFTAIQNFDQFPRAQKDDIVRKLIKPSVNGLFKLESDHFLFESNYEAYDMIKVVVWLEQVVHAYSMCFNFKNTLVKNKILVLALNKDDSTEKILKEKGVAIEIDDKRHHYEAYDRKSKIYVIIEKKRFSRVSYSLIDLLSGAFNEPFKNGSSYTYASALMYCEDLGDFKSIKKQMLFSNCMSTIRDRNALSDGDYEAFEKDMVAGNFGNYRNVKSQIVVFLMQKEDRESIYQFTKIEGDQFFTKPNRLVLLKEFIAFYQKEVPLGYDYCYKILNELKYFNSSNYRSMQSNEEKIIIIDAKYKDLAMAKYFKGVHYFLCEKYKESVEMILSMDADVDKYPMVYSVLAMNYAKLNKMEEAKAYKAKALADNPSDSLMKRHGSTIPN